MNLNPLKDAGRSGFKWRDEVILESVREQGDLKLKAQALALYVGVAGVSLGAVILSGNYLSLIGVIVAFFGAVASRYIGNNVILPALTIPICAILVGVTSPLWFVVVWVGLCTTSFFLRGETFFLTLSLLTAFASTPPVIATVLCIALVLGAGFVAITYTRQHTFANWGRTSPYPHAPLGFQRAAERALARALKTKTGDISRKELGSVTEVETARELMRIPRAYLFHDIPLPGAHSANIDHVALTTKGIFVVDSKRYRGTIAKGEQGVVLRQPSRKGEKAKSLSEVIRQVGWAGNAIGEATQCPTYVIVAVHGGKVDNSPILVQDPQTGQKIAFVALPELVSFVEIMDKKVSLDALKKLVGEFAPLAPHRRPVYTGTNGKRLRR